MRSSDMKSFRLIKLFALTLTALVFAPVSVSALSGADFQAGRIIDDSKFFSGPTMSVNDIQTFLNAKVPSCDNNGTQIYSGSQTRAQYGTSRGYPPPYTCLKEYRDNTVSKPAETGLCNGYGAANQSAAEIIFNVSVSCNINPQVLIVLLQKEQSLVTDDWPWSIQYRSATGYGCPDTAACDSQYYGLFNQIYNAARQFKRYAKHPTEYSYQSGRNNFIKWHPDFWNGSAWEDRCGGSTVYIQNQATAGLYNYTPYQPNATALSNIYGGQDDGCSSYGNRNFWRIFHDWFGSTFGPPDYSCKNGANVTGAPTGQTLLRNRLSGAIRDSISIAVPNNTGSACAEIHTWADGQLQGWAQHIATNSYAFNPLESSIISGNTSYTASRLYKVDYRGTNSGRVEVHGWTGDVQGWISHIATNAGPVNPNGSRIITADIDGDGVSEFYLVDYSATGSGMVEVHGWTPSFQQWARHTATNLPSAGYNQATDDIIAADTDGDGKDELMYVKYSNTGSGRVEVHGWSQSLTQWVRHTATSAGSY